ncbi:hypothetical protein [Riemerella anatipestifer]|uniref:hypothetical protein n=1 Tax=Riemerella anatipestifer TaxID=34085 RepID=UPI002363C3E9|nr:hypothetical protein [Riemerella anatipestifer]
MGNKRSPNPIWKYRNDNEGGGLFLSRVDVGSSVGDNPANIGRYAKAGKRENKQN